MKRPYDTDPFVALAAAAEHLRAADGPAEIELEWWADPDDEADGGPQRRFTVTLRTPECSAMRYRGLGVLNVTRPADAPPDVPDTIPAEGYPEGWEPPCPA